MRAVTLRPHHGMCLAFFVGYGYSEAFNRRMRETLEQMQENPLVQLTAQEDEICAACPNAQQGRCSDGERVRGYDRAVLGACGLEEGVELPFLDFADIVQRQVLDAGRRKEICPDCQWSPLCNGKSRWKK